MADKRDKLRVFISYARSDGAAFAEELLQGLEVAGFDAFLDRHDIAAAEDWEARLHALIQSADTIVFVLTPASCASERCAWEVERAENLAKRIIPVVWARVEEAATPDALKRLNYIYFSEGHSYSKGLSELAEALRINLEWVREHTRLGELALRWEARNRTDALLLRGVELDAARHWLSSGAIDAPAITDAHRTFINASEAAEGALIKKERTRRRALILSLSAATTVFAVLGAAAAFFGVVADNNARLAREALARSLIERAWTVGAEERDLALKYALAGLAVDDQESELARSALAFATERGEHLTTVPNGLSSPVQVSAISPDGGFVALIGENGLLVFVDVATGQASAPLLIGPARYAGFSADGQRLFVIATEDRGAFIDRASGLQSEIGPVGSADRATFSPDGQRMVLSGLAREARLWDLTSGRQVAAMAHESYLTGADFSSDGARVLTASGDNTARVWDARTGNPISRFATSSYVIDAAFSADNELVATSEGRQLTAGGDDDVAGAEGAVKIWSAETGRLLRAIAYDADVSDIAFSPDGALLLGLDELGRFVQWEVATGRVVTLFDGRRFGVRDGIFAADGATFVGASPNFAAVLWESATNHVIGLLPGDGAVGGRVLGGAGARSVVLLEDGRLLIWDYSRALQSAGALTDEACGGLRARSEVRFSDLERASDPLIAEAWRGSSDRPLC